MQCYHPYRIRNPILRVSDKKREELKCSGHSIEAFIRQRERQYIQLHGEPPMQYIDVPCGKCPACLSRRVSDWTFRLEQEAFSATSCWFLTLTYSDDNVPIKNSEFTLNKSDLQKFFKRLRKKLYGSKKGSLRYYAIGEYGGNYGRPHYHAIIYNLPDMPPRELEKLISGLWPDRFQIGRTTIGAMVYTAGYFLAKMDKYSDNQVKPFSCCSQFLGDKKTYTEFLLTKLKSGDYRISTPCGCFRVPRRYRDIALRYLSVDEIKEMIRNHDDLTDEYVTKMEEKYTRDYGRDWKHVLSAQNAAYEDRKWKDYINRKKHIR